MHPGRVPGEEGKLGISALLPNFEAEARQEGWCPPKFPSWVRTEAKGDGSSPPGGRSAPCPPLQLPFSPENGRKTRFQQPNPSDSRRGGSEGAPGGRTHTPRIFGAPPNTCLTPWMFLMA